MITYDAACHIFIFLGVISTLSSSAQSKLPAALAQSTRRAYTAMFRLFLAFLCFNQVSISQVNVNILLAFLEFLYCNGTKYSQLLNYISAIRTFSLMYDVKIPDLKHSKINLSLKAIQKANPFSVKLHHLIDIPLLNSIISTCDLTYLGYMFKSIYLLAFFGFFRLSNLVPHVISDFSMLKHLTRGDVFFSTSHVIILLKWSKTMQTNDQAKLIKLPILNNQLYPQKALKTVFQLSPGSKNTPLFQFKASDAWLPMTDNRVRCHLRNILSLLHLDSNYITFHSFRRSGASFAFNHNVSIQEIQKHGTWTSDCVWRYVSDSTDAGSQVAATFATLLS